MCTIKNWLFFLLLLRDTFIGSLCNEFLIRFGEESTSGGTRWLDFLDFVDHEKIKEMFKDGNESELYYPTKYRMSQRVRGVNFQHHWIEVV